MLAGCVQNTVTGNLDSCSTDACICKVGFAGLDCCECDLTGVNGQPHYLDPVTNLCTRESMHGLHLLTPQSCVTLVDSEKHCTSFLHYFNECALLNLYALKY